MSGEPRQHQQQQQAFPVNGSSDMRSDAAVAGQGMPFPHPAPHTYQQLQTYPNFHNTTGSSDVWQWPSDVWSQHPFQVAAQQQQQQQNYQQWQQPLYDPRDQYPAAWQPPARDDRQRSERDRNRHPDSRVNEREHRNYEDRNRYPDNRRDERRHHNYEDRNRYPDSRRDDRRHRHDEDRHRRDYNRHHDSGPVRHREESSSRTRPSNSSRDEDRDRHRSQKGETSRRTNRSRSPPPRIRSPEPKVEMSEVLTRSVSWIRSFPAEPFYKLSSTNQLTATDKLVELQTRFKNELVDRNKAAAARRTPFEFPPRNTRFKHHHHHHHNHHEGESCDKSDSESCCSSESDSEEEDEDTVGDSAFEELERKKTHPWRLHDELWYNEAGEMNDGPLCRCSLKARKSGIRHGIYPGEDHIVPCDPLTNNSDRLFHYRLAVSPLTNYCNKFPTTIVYDKHSYVFDGFSLLSHSRITDYPPCKLIRFNIEYTIEPVEEQFPVNFTVQDLDMVTQFLFHEVLELVDIDWKASGDENGCPRFHLFPRFARLIEEDGKELLSPAIIIQYLLNANKELCDAELKQKLHEMSDSQWQDHAKKVKGMIAVKPGSKPCAVRVDQIDREGDDVARDQDQAGTTSKDKVMDRDPVIVHFGIRPPQLSYAGNPKYQKAWRDYVKFRHLLANKPKVAFTDRQTLLQKEEKLQELRLKSDLKRDVTVVVPTDGFYQTGLFCDVIQFALMIPVVICHLRFHQSLSHLEKTIGYSFTDRYLLQLALTHPSYRENFGTNPDHARNTLTNCGMRQPHYGDRKVHYQHTRKRGINMLIDIMSRLGREHETTSNINHNERLEFLGDAVVEFLSSIHLYFMFPDLEEGGLATYRAAIVQNQHLAVLAKKLQLEQHMLYAHGSDLCHDLELRHAMANCFEALMGALFLDGGIEVADRVFSNTLFGDNSKLLDVWVNYPKHPIQRQEPNGDRSYIQLYPRLQQLEEFEKLCGIQFTHIRLLARAFTHRSVGFNYLTLGSNQRMEFLGDTVLQLVASEYLYKFFPEHHEGHLSLLRSSLVNNKTQAVVCDDLGMTEFASYNYAKGELKPKDRADLLEAFLGALYVDKGLSYCVKFCEVCFFPRLEHFIMNQDWNDPKSKLQQCCLTLRSLDGGEPDIPVYKVTESLGPTNTREYVVAVRFRNRRLATGRGHSIQEAEMNAAENALKASKELFPQLNRQKRVIERSVKKWESPQTASSSSSSSSSRKQQQEKFE